MPFDGADYRPTQPPPSGRPTISDKALGYGIAIFAAAMLFIPISLGSLVDIIRYLQAP